MLRVGLIKYVRGLSYLVPKYDWFIRMEKSRSMVLVINLKRMILTLGRINLSIKFQWLEREVYRSLLSTETHWSILVSSSICRESKYLDLVN